MLRFLGHAGHQAPGRNGHKCRILHRARQQLPDASGRRTAPSQCGNEDHPHGADPGKHRDRAAGGLVVNSANPAQLSLDPTLAEPFPKAALHVLGNAQLRKNVAHATDVIQSKRNRLVAEKTDWAELRNAASAIRAHVLDHLDTYLTQFEKRCTAAGGVVHWAADAEEARQIILAILNEERAE